MMALDYVMQRELAPARRVREAEEKQYRRGILVDSMYAIVARRFDTHPHRRANSFDVGVLYDLATKNAPDAQRAPTVDEICELARLLIQAIRRDHEGATVDLTDKPGTLRIWVSFPA
jgi:hypothetical protein